MRSSTRPHRPAAQVCAERLLEPLGGLVIACGEQRAGVAQAERDPDPRAFAGGRFDLRHARSRLFGTVDVQGGFGEVAYDPAGHHRVITGAVRIEEALRGRIGVGVAAGSERGQHPAELGQGNHDVRTRDRPEIVLLDIQQPDIDGLVVAEQIAAAAVVLISSREAASYGTRLSLAPALGPSSRRARRI